VTAARLLAVVGFWWSLTVAEHLRPPAAARGSWFVAVLLVVGVPFVALLVLAVPELLAARRRPAAPGVPLGAPPA
jgi:hypothetical protein